MPANDLAMDYVALLRQIGREINASRNAADWSSTTTQDVADVIASGLRQTYWPPTLPGETTPHEWSFLQPKLGTLAIHAPYSTGTLAATTGTVTLTGGAWPAWAAQADLWTGGNRYSVASRTSGLVIVLDDATVSFSAGATYELILTYYTLPDDFGGLVNSQSLTLRRDVRENSSSPSPKVVSEAYLSRYDQWPHVKGVPELVSFAPTATSTTDQRWYARFYPLPDKTYNLEYRYQVVPPVMNGTTITHHYGGPQLSNLVLLSCLDKAMRFLYSSDEYFARFMTELEAQVRRDRAMYNKETLGFGVFSDGNEMRAMDYLDLITFRRHATTLGTINL